MREQRSSTDIEDIDRHGDTHKRQLIDGASREGLAMRCCEACGSTSADAVRQQRATLALRARIAELEAALRRIVEHYDARSVLYASDADLATTMAEIARQATDAAE